MSELGEAINTLIIVLPQCADNLAAPLGAKWEKSIRRASLGLMARLGKSIAKQSEGRAGEQYLLVGGWMRKGCLRH